MYQCVNTLEEHTDNISSLAVVDNKIISGSYNMINICDISTGKCEKTLYDTDLIHVLTNAGDKIITGLYNGHIKIWKLDGECEQTLVGHTGSVVTLFRKRL